MRDLAVPQGQPSPVRWLLLAGVASACVLMGLLVASFAAGSEEAETPNAETSETAPAQSAATCATAEILDDLCPYGGRFVPAGFRGCRVKRSQESRAQLRIQWQVCERLLPADAGHDDLRGPTLNSLLARFDRPVLVLVTARGRHPDPLCKIWEIVLGNEKIALGLKAFRCVVMSPEAAAQDEILAGYGETVPRMLIVDPVEPSIEVIESRKIKVSNLFRAMRDAFANCYDPGSSARDPLSHSVKANLRILNEKDTLARERDDLQQQAEPDTGRLAEIRDALQVLRQKERDLWVKACRPRSGESQAVDS